MHVRCFELNVCNAEPLQFASRGGLALAYTEVTILLGRTRAAPHWPLISRIYRMRHALHS